MDQTTSNPLDGASDARSDDDPSDPSAAEQGELRYVPNPKHKEPWQRGRRGSLCPPEISLEEARSLLNQSVLFGKKRYVVRQGRAFCAQADSEGGWHGYPEGWRFVPAKLTRTWVKTKRITKRDIDRFWERES